MAEKEHIFAKAVRMIMFAVLAVYPFGIAAFYIWPNVMDSIWTDELHRIDERHLVLIAAGAPIVCIGLAWRLIPGIINKNKIFQISIALFLIALSIRVLAIEVLQTEPVSDFLTCYTYAAGESGQEEYLATYPYLGAYAVTLRIFFDTFGISVWTAQFLNAVITSTIPAALFLAVRRITGKDNVGITAGLAYALCPSMIIYTAIPSCEHFSQFYLAWAAFAVAGFYTAERHHKHRWIWGVAAGILLGMVILYKSGLRMVLVPSFLMASFCYEWIPLIVTAVRERKKVIRQLAVIAGQCLIVIAAAIMISRVGTNYVRTELGYPVIIRNRPFMAGFYDGLCIEGNGVWNSKVQGYISQISEEYDSSKANQIFIAKLKEQYKDDPKAFLRLLEHKYKVNWCSEDYYYFTFSGDNTVVQGTWAGEVLFALVPRVYIMFMYIILSLGCVIFLVKKIPAQQLQACFFTTGIIFLFTLALVLIQAQGRYKSNIMPLVCMMFAFCMDGLLESLSQIRKMVYDRIADAFTTAFRS